ncbi:MAG: MFS transporter [Phycisphaerales bacterium]|nr:MFS transporter [Phycisphaerales bacterium]
MTDAAVNPATGHAWRWSTRVVPYVLAFLACLPDSMSYPGLKAVVSNRFQQDEASTQLFTIAALVGAVVVIPLLGWLRRFRPRNVILVAGILQAGVVGAMALPVSWWMLLGLRGIQGGFDLVTLALITTVAARINGGSGRTFGLLGSSIMAGLAFGFVSGGHIAGVAPWLIFPVAAGFALLLGFSAGLIPPMHEDTTAPRKRFTGAIDRFLATGLACNASDRFLAGITTVIIPLLLAGAFEMSSRTIGLVMAAPLLMAVVGGLLAGLAVDRLGAITVRVIGCTAYGGGLVLLMFSGNSGSLLLVVATAIMGFGVTAILPTSLVLGTSQGRNSGDPSVVGWIQAGGQVGYVVGILGGFAITSLLGGTTPWIIVSAVLLYLAWNAGWLGVLMVRSGETMSPEAAIDGIGPVARTRDWPLTRPRPQSASHRRKQATNESIND